MFTAGEFKNLAALRVALNMSFLCREPHVLCQFCDVHRLRNFAASSVLVAGSVSFTFGYRKMLNHMMERSWIKSSRGAELKRTVAEANETKSAMLISKIEIQAGKHISRKGIEHRQGAAVGPGPLEACRFVVRVKKRF